MGGARPPDPNDWIPTQIVAATAARDPFRVSKRVLPVISLHCLWSCVIVAIRLLVGAQWKVTSLLHSLTGGILGLLLAFRTNQAYQRYWSACTSWAHLHTHSHNIARQSAQVGSLGGGDLRTYSTLVRHLIALPIALKQRLRGTMDPSEFFWPVLLPSEANAMLRSPCPHLVLLSSMSTLIQPLRAKDDGSGKALALWGELERNVAALQSAACQLDLVAKLPPPASYSLLTSRFVGIWVATLPLVLIDLIHPACVPLVTLLCAWALYSTSELAKLLDEPFGRARRAARGAQAPETVPVERYVDQIITELKQQVGIATTLAERVDEGAWAVASADLDPLCAPGDSAPSSSTSRGRRGANNGGGAAERPRGTAGGGSSDDDDDDGTGVSESFTRVSDFDILSEEDEDWTPGGS